MKETPFIAESIIECKLQMMRLELRLPHGRDGKFISTKVKKTTIINK